MTDAMYKILGVLSGNAAPVRLFMSGVEMVGLINLLTEEDGRTPDTALLLGVEYSHSKETGEEIYKPLVTYVAIAAIAAFEPTDVAPEQYAMMAEMAKAARDGTKPPAMFVVRPKPEEPPPRAGQLTPEEIAEIESRIP